MTKEFIFDTTLYGNQKSAFIALVGKPNVGKSSLLNRLVGEKLAIVTDKPQTTRTRITGVLTVEETQLVFLDTPGMHKPKNALSKKMIESINETVSDVDLAVLVVEPTGNLTRAEEGLIEDFKNRRLNAIAVLNKIDLIQDKTQILEKMQLLNDKFHFDAIVPVSALTGEGIDELMKVFMDSAVQSPHYFPDDTLTEQPEKVICAELIREKILINMRDEIPHGVAVVIESMKERQDKPLMDMEAMIYCERKSHKGMIIGKGGAMLKNIATQARQEMEQFLDIKINLQCRVKVKEDWRNEENLIRSFFPKSPT